MILKPPYSYSNLAQYSACAARHNYERILKLKPLEDTQHPAAARGTSLHEICDKYTKGEITVLPSELSRFKPVLDKLVNVGALAEVKLAITRDLQPCDYDDPNAYFYGIIDTLELDGPQACVGDWKSGKERDYSHQLRFYTLLVFISYPDVNLIHTRIRYIDLYKSVPGISYSRPHVSQIMAEFSYIVDRMLKDRIRAPTPSDICGWCPYNKQKLGICKWS